MRGEVEPLFGRLFPTFVSVMNGTFCRIAEGAPVLSERLVFIPYCDSQQCAVLALGKQPLIVCSEGQSVTGSFLPPLMHRVCSQTTAGKSESDPKLS